MMAAKDIEMAGKFRCLSCGGYYPEYYRPDSVHQRTLYDICYECHMEEQDTTPSKLRFLPRQVIDSYLPEYWYLHLRF